jgi:hypothetical protein
MEYRNFPVAIAILGLQCVKEQSSQLALCQVLLPALRPGLFERVLVLRGGAAAVDRVEGLLLLAGRSGYRRGAGLTGEGVLLNPFEEDFGILILGSRDSTGHFVAALDCSIFKGRVFPVRRVQGGEDSSGALSGVEAWQASNKPFCPLWRAIRTSAVDRQPVRIRSDGFWRHAPYRAEVVGWVWNFFFRSEDAVERCRNVAEEGCEINPIQLKPDQSRIEVAYKGIDSP